MNTTFPYPMRLMLSFLIPCFFFCQVLQAQNPCIEPSLIDTNAICPGVYLPVCGCDGVTYSNSCEALHAGVVQWSPGECPGVSDCEGLVVDFNALSTNTLSWYFGDVSTIENGQLLSWNWDFGDGTTSEDQNPNHVFPAPGNYVVCLTVDAGAPNGLICRKTFCRPLTVVEECVDNCLYAIDLELDGVALHTSLTPVLPDTPFFFYVQWSLDDGIATGTGLEFDKLIAEPGVHKICASYPTGDFSPFVCTVCKTFEVSALCVDTTQIDSLACTTNEYIPVCGCDGVTYVNSCHAYYYGGVKSWTPGECGSICNNMVIDFEGFNSGGSLTYWTFNDLTSFPGGQVSSWYWDFGNGQISFEQNPSLNFLDTGTYEVCLRVSGLFAGETQCGSTLCKTIRVPQQFCSDPSVIDLERPCIAVYEPVCGCNGVTYDNDCIAYYKYGITEWTPGVCPDLCIDPTRVDTLLPCIEIHDPVCGCDDQTYQNECFALRNGVTAWKQGPCCQLQQCYAFFTATRLSNQTVLLVNLSPDAETWTLDLGNGSQVFGFFDSLIYEYNSPGIYQLCLEITNFNGSCTDQYCLIQDMTTSAVSDPASRVQLSVQPNPTRDVTILKTRDAELQSVIVVDVFGKMLLRQPLSGNESSISMSGLPAGIYFLHVVTDKGSVSRKIAVQR